MIPPNIFSPFNHGPHGALNIVADCKNQKILALKKIVFIFRTLKFSNIRPKEVYVCMYVCIMIMNNANYS